MIKVFGQTDKIFASNGDVVIKPIKARVHKEDNGDYYLDLECGLNYVDFIQEGNIIISNTPTGDQPFRVTNPQKTRTKITVKAMHVFFDSKNYLIADTNVVDKSCANALTQLNNALEPTSEFTVGSNISTVNSYRCVRESFYTAIMTVLERWGGHLVRDGFYIGIQSSIGTDRGVTIEYKKNLKEITVEEQWDDVVTKILPVGKDGTLLNAVNPSASIYISSATQYSIPYCKTVSFEQEIEREDYPSDTAYKTALVNDLRSQANAYLLTNSVPKVNYTLKAHIDHVTDIGDTIRVTDSRLNLNLLTNVISYTYNCVTEQYEEVEFGNFKPTLSGLIPTLTAGVNQTVNSAISVVSGDISILNGDVSDINDELLLKQELLVSGLNIKTVNGTSILGSGNIDLSILGSLVVETYTHAYANIASGSVMNWSETKTKVGYYPIGVVGFRTTRQALVVNRCNLTNVTNGSCTINMNARADIAVGSSTAEMYVLWVKI